MKLSLKNILLALFLLFSIGDVVTTLMIKYKFPIFNEAHPLYLLGVSIYLVMAVKMLIVGYLIYFCVKKYFTVKYPTIRYAVVYFIVLMVFMNLAVVVNNWNYYQLPVEDVKPVPVELRQQFYTEHVGDLKVMDNLTPKGFKIPLLYLLFGLNIFQFMVWRSFENEE